MGDEGRGQAEDNKEGQVLGPAQAATATICINLQQFGRDGGSEWPSQQLGLAVFRGFDHSACVAAFPARSYAEPSYRVQQFGPSLLDRQTKAEDVLDFMRTPILYALPPQAHPRPPSSATLSHWRAWPPPCGDAACPVLVYTSSPWAQYSVLHATPTCHPYWWCWWCWWCARAGITLERHSMSRNENRCC